MHDLPQEALYGPFPRPPATAAGWPPVAGARLRRFGSEPGDLDVDFATDDRSRLVTELLLRATVPGEGEALDADSFWRLPVAARLHALIALCRLAGEEEIAWSLTCPAARCGELIELSLPLSELARRAEAAAQGSEPPEIEHGGARWRLRLPTGEDLRRWGAPSGTAPSDAEMLVSLVSPVSPGEPAEPALAVSKLSAKVLAAAEVALAAADPLVDVRVESACPTCGGPLEVPVNVEEEALAILARAQEELFRQVGVLASAFHWSEREVLRLPERRRRRYLALVGTGPTVGEEGM